MKSIRKRHSVTVIWIVALLIASFFVFGVATFSSRAVYVQEGVSVPRASVVAVSNKGYSISVTDVAGNLHAYMLSTVFLAIGMTVVAFKILKDKIGVSWCSKRSQR